MNNSIVSYYLHGKNKQRSLLLLMRRDTILFPKDGSQAINISGLKKEFYFENKLFDEVISQGSYSQEIYLFSILH